MKKVFVTGASGLVGSRFIEIYSSEYEIAAPDFPEFDLTDPQKVKDAVVKFNPDVIVNFAAYTNVSEAENQRDNRDGSCWRINVDGVKNLTSIINPEKTHFIHISTDYIFSNSDKIRGPYFEDTSPETDSSRLTWYGYTKAEGERLINNIFGKTQTILRLIYPVRAKYAAKLDYLRKPLSLFDQGLLYPLFNDQEVTISFVDEVSLALEKIIKEKVYGTFHASTPDTSTPYELVSYLIEKVRGIKGAVDAVTFAEFMQNPDNSPIRYQKYGGLMVEKTQDVLGIKFSPWKKVVEILADQGIGG
jgi:dTDP-4-dehydrorhamnose reductase